MPPNIIKVSCFVYFIGKNCRNNFLNVYADIIQTNQITKKQTYMFIIDDV
jgi:hypothetical protein